MNGDQFQFFLCMGLMAFLFCQCGTSKYLSDNHAKSDYSRSEIKDHIDAYKGEFEWFSAKSKLSIDVPEYTGNVNVQIRIRKDSLIWVHISRLAVEASRMLITQDSLFFIDRLDKTYLRESIVNVEKALGVEFNYDLLQGVLVGAPVIDLKDDSFFFSTNHQSYLLNMKYDHKNYELLLDKTTLLLTSQKVEIERGEVFLIEYMDYEANMFPPMAKKRLLSIRGQKGGSYEFEFSGIKAEWNVPKKTIFNIPSRYRRVFL